MRFYLQSVWCVGVVSVMWSYRVGPCTALSECKLKCGVGSTHYIEGHQITP
jgi:hypothetical protein